MVAEQRQNTDAEHRRNKKQEQDVEFGLSVRQFVLMEETGENQRGISDNFSLQAAIYGTKRNKAGRGRTSHTIITLHTHYNDKVIDGELEQHWRFGEASRVTLGQFSADFLRQSFSTGRNESG